MLWNPEHSNAPHRWPFRVSSHVLWRAALCGSFLQTPPPLCNPGMRAPAVVLALDWRLALLKVKDSLDSVLGPLGSHGGLSAGGGWVWLALEHNCSRQQGIGSTAGAGLCPYRASACRARSLQSKEHGPGRGGPGLRPAWLWQATKKPSGGPAYNLDHVGSPRVTVRLKACQVFRTEKGVLTHFPSLRCDAQS